MGDKLRERLRDILISMQNRYEMYSRAENINDASFLTMSPLHLCLCLSLSLSCAFLSMRFKLNRRLICRMTRTLKKISLIYDNDYFHVVIHQTIIHGRNGHYIRRSFVKPSFGNLDSRR